MDTKGEAHFSMGVTLRLVAATIIAISLPFLIANPSNPITQGIFAFGNFMMVIGANVP